MPRIVPSRDRDPCCAALSSCGLPATAVKPGKQGIKGEHRSLIDVADVCCSLSLDDATADARRRGEKCWDYLLCVAGLLFAVEVHQCKLENVAEMILKRDGTRRLLARYLELEVRRWLWLVPANAPISIRKGTAEERRLGVARIEMPRRVLRPADLE